MRTSVRRHQVLEGGVADGGGESPAYLAHIRARRILAFSSVRWRQLTKCSFWGSGISRRSALAAKLLSYFPAQKWIDFIVWARICLAGGKLQGRTEFRLTVAADADFIL